MSGTAGLTTAIRKGAPAYLPGAFVLAELGVLHLASHQRYVPLTRAENAAALQLAHTFSLVLALAFVLTLALAVWRGGLAPPALAGVRTRRALWALHLGAFLGLLALYPALPPFGEVPRLLDAFELAVFTAKIAAFLAFLATAFALVMPAAFRPYARSRTARAVIAAGLVAVTAVAGSGWFTIAAIRRPIEDATLALSVALYELTGLPAPEIVQDGINPVMHAAGFAIVIAPVCSGYQGIFSALVLLGGYVALERRALRLPRAALLVLLALGAVFTLNAARIALLFAIGVTGRPEVAVNGFHSNFGVLSLLSVVALAILALESAPFRKGRAGAAPPLALPPGELERIGRLGLPLAGLMASGIVVGLGAGVVNWAYPVSAAVGLALLWIVRDALAARLDPGPTPAGFLAGIAVFALWVLMVPPDRAASSAVAEALRAAPAALVGAWIVVRVIGASVVVPVVEELAFRAGLMRLVTLLLPAAWSRRAVAAAALALSSLAFGLLHAEILAGTVAGLAFGALALWRGSLSDAILAHAVTNFLLALTVLGLGHWSYW